MLVAWRRPLRFPCRLGLMIQAARELRTLNLYVILAHRRN